MLLENTNSTLKVFLDLQKCSAYLKLCKPKVVGMIVFTAFVGMLLATPQFPEISLVFFGLLGIGLASASAASVNHVLDYKIDKIMARTHSRPLPQGTLSAKRAMIFAIILGCTGITLLTIFVNVLTAVLTTISLIVYAVIYTLFLKHKTPYNIVWGGAAGAMPPVLGWAAINEGISFEGIILFLIIFLWTPPHFWALAIRRKDDYARAGIPMLPVTHGVKFTSQQIFYYTTLLFIVSIFPYLINMSGVLYLVFAIPLGILYMRHAFIVLSDGGHDKTMASFKFSIQYLFWLFAGLLLDHYVDFL